MNIPCGNGYFITKTVLMCIVLWILKLRECLFYSKYAAEMKTLWLWSNVDHIGRILTRHLGLIFHRSHISQSPISTYHMTLSWFPHYINLLYLLALFSAWHSCLLINDILGVVISHVIYMGHFNHFPKQHFMLQWSAEARDWITTIYSRNPIFHTKLMK